MFGEWTTGDIRLAERAGWKISNVSEGVCDGARQLERRDGFERFPTDERLTKHIINGAMAGESLHIKAISSLLMYPTTACYVAAEKEEYE